MSEIFPESILSDAPVLDVKNIRKSFGGTEVLKGIDFTLNEGSVLVIIGSSGSGKTTLLRSLNFLEQPDIGQIYLHGKLLFDAEDSAASYNENEIRKKRLHFGLVFQSFNLFPQYTVLKNITLAPQMLACEKLKKNKGKRDDKKAALAEIEKKARELLHTVGLDDKIDAYPCMLSGGQQQRVAIARALALQPDILCFDEPTSALDPELTGEVLRVIRSLKERGYTMIVVTHEMEFARSVADKVLFMSDGIIEESGTPEQIFSNPSSPKTKAFLAHALDRSQEL